MFGRLLTSSDIPDTVSQFLNQRRCLARKSSHDGGVLAATIELDDGRVYFPGQTVTARVTLPASINSAEVASVDVEVKAWTYSYAWQSNGSSTYPVFERDVHFSIEGTLPITTSSSASTSAATGLHISKAANGASPNTWVVSTKIPTEVQAKVNWRQQAPTTEVPSTFKDVKTGSLSNAVYWTVKLTAKRTANLKRNYRIWKPFLVLPLSPVPVASLPMTSLPMLATSPTGTLPHPKSIAASLPANWSTYVLESKIKSALVFSKAVISTHVFFPSPQHIPPGPVPVLLHVAVSAKKEADLLPEGSVRLPDLPLSAASESDESDRWTQDIAPSSSANNEKGKEKDRNTASDFRPSFELVRHVRSRAYSYYNSSRHRIPVSVQWDTPAFLTASELQPGQAIDHGFAWTDPMPTAEAGLITSSTPTEGESAAATAAAADRSSRLPYTRSALLTGRILIDVPPPTNTYNLRVKYKLRLRWAQPGMGNSLSAPLGRWVTSSGVDRAQLAQLGERKADEEMSEEQVRAWRELDRRVLGPRYALLLDPASATAADEEDEDDVKGGKFDDDDDDQDAGGIASKAGGFFAKLVPRSKGAGGRKGKKDGADEKGASEDEDDDDVDSSDSDDVAHLKARMAAADLAAERRGGR